jgi:hypothetical protein
MRNTTAPGKADTQHRLNCWKVSASSEKVYLLQVRRNCEHPERGKQTKLFIMDATRTPGEWQTSEGQIYSDQKATTLAMVHTSGGPEGIAISDEEAEANARFICKAVNGYQQIANLLLLAMADPQKLRDSAGAYWIAQRYPVTEDVQKKADYYRPFADALRAIEQV